MKAIHTYLNFDGNTEEAFNFYKSVFGGEFTMVQHMKDTPESGKLSPREQNLIMHISLPVGQGGMLMASDIAESMGHKLIVGNNVHLSLHADSKEEADKLFNGLSKGGKTTMPMEKTFWGSYFGMCTDKFAIQWMVSFDENQ